MQRDTAMVAVRQQVGNKRGECCMNMRLVYLSTRALLEAKICRYRSLQFRIIYRLNSGTRISSTVGLTWDVALMLEIHNYCSCSFSDSDVVIR